MASWSRGAVILGRVLDTTPIRSASNPLVKRVRAVARGGDPDRMLLEGDRLVGEALARGLELEALLLAERRADEAARFEGGPLRVVGDELLDSLSRLTTSPGILAIAEVPASGGPDALPTAADALVVVALGMQDPGNLGALARSAEAAGAGALVVVAGGCRPWNEKALRGSMGSLLRLPVVELTDPCAAWDALVARDVRPVVARTRGGAAPAAVDWSGRVALWVSGETGELPDELAARVDAAQGVTIPMAGDVESLNVTAAAAVLLFAAGRTA
jgi:TrmH family RNA methyltransferase